MTNILLILAALLLVAIFLVIFRASKLISIFRNDSDPDKVSQSNNIHAYLFLILPLVGFSLAGWYAVHHLGLIIPPHASKNADITEPLFHQATVVILLMFVITNAALFFFAFKYRYKEGYKATFFTDNVKLEIVWTIVPAVILVLLVVQGWQAWKKIMYTAPENAQQIEVMGHQFAWKVRYPGVDGKIGKYNFRYTDATNEMGLDFSDKKNDDDFMVSEIHIQKNVPVVFNIRARDVLHSFSLPHFRQKMDAVPGMPTKLWLTPTKTTAEMRQELQGRPEYQTIDEKSGKTRADGFNYEIACQEVCGRGHFAMRLVIVVDDEIDYKKWLATQKPFTEVNKEYVAKARIQQQKAKASGVAMVSK